MAIVAAPGAFTVVVVSEVSRDDVFFVTASGFVEGMGVGVVVVLDDHLDSSLVAFVGSVEDEVVVPFVESVVALLLAPELVVVMIFSWVVLFVCVAIPALLLSAK